MSDFFEPKKCAAYAELAIYAKGMNELLLTEKLGGVFSPAKKEGDLDLWTYRTEKKPTCCVSERVAELMEVFKNRTDTLKNVKEDFDNCIITVNVVVYNDQRLLPGLGLEKEQIRFIADLGASFDVDMYA